MYTLENIEKVYYTIENDSDFGKPIATGSFKPIKTVDGGVSYETNRETLPNLTMRQRPHARLAPVVTNKKLGAVSVQSYLNSAGIPSTSSFLPSDPTGDIIETIMGGSYDVSGSLSLATTSGIFSSDNLPYVGAAIGAYNNGKFEVRNVKSHKDADEAYLYFGFSAIPSGSQFYGSKNYYLTKDPDKAVQFAFLREKDYSRIRHMSCQGNFSLGVGSGELATITFDMQSVDWMREDEIQTVSNFFSAPFDEHIFTDGIPALVDDISFYFGTNDIYNSEASATQICVQSVDLTSNINYIPVPCLNKKSGIARWKKDGAAPVFAGTFITSEDTGKTFYDYWKNNTSCYLSFTIGSRPGDTVSVFCPNVFITNVQQSNGEGLQNQTITFECYEANNGPKTFNQFENSQNNDPSNYDLSKSAVVISKL